MCYSDLSIWQVYFCFIFHTVNTGDMYAKTAIFISHCLYDHLYASFSGGSLPRGKQWNSHLGGPFTALITSFFYCGQFAIFFGICSFFRRTARAYHASCISFAGRGRICFGSWIYQRISYGGYINNFTVRTKSMYR